MDLKAINDFLQQVELFASLNDEERSLFAEQMEQVVFEPEQYLFEENSPRECLYLITKGDVELVKRTTFGQEERLSYFGRGDFLAEGALLDDSPHSTSARPLIRATTLVMRREVFETISAEHPAVAMKLLASLSRVISGRMQQASTRAVDVTAQYFSGRTRDEHDLLGSREVPYENYYGIQTLRALENFDISGIPLSRFPALVRALAMVKLAAARTNRELNLLDAPVAAAIEQACIEIINGKHHPQFVVDLIQGGAGTSTNMNTNEVIANRALEIMGHERGQYRFCHPNSHVNMSQSTNDAYPSALKIAFIFSNAELVESLALLAESFQVKANEFARIIKMGRTQLQDAVPMTMGQEFEAYAVTLSEEIRRLEANAELFLELNMGGTAIGTGINADPRYAKLVIGHLQEITKLNVCLSSNLVEETQDTGAFVMYSSAIKRLAVKLSKIANDLRLLSSGPRAGFNEINLPAMQPGSSIMPGKVNPVIPEVVNQIAFKVIGNDLTVTLAAEAGQLELNVMEPVIAQSIFESTQMLINGMKTFKYRCIDGITANEAVCRRHVKKSIGIITALVPILGYETCTVLARAALQEGRGVYELVLERSLLSREDLDHLLDPESMIGNGEKH
ncbi:MAG: aspartate ammonia-lyase [bacterium]